MNVCRVAFNAKQKQRFDASKVRKRRKKKDEETSSSRWILWWNSIETSSVYLSKGWFDRIRSVDSYVNFSMVATTCMRIYVCVCTVHIFELETNWRYSGWKLRRLNCFAKSTFGVLNSVKQWRCTSLRTKLLDLINERIDTV